MSNPKPMSDQDVNSARQLLKMLLHQVEAKVFDADYMARQLNKLNDFVEQAALAQKSQLASFRFEALYNVSRIIGTSLNLQTVLEQVMDAVIQLTGAERGFLMLRDDDGKLQAKVARNLDQRTLTSDEFSYSNTITTHVMNTGEPILTTNAMEDPRFAGGASIISKVLRSIMVTPLRARGEIIGVAYVENRIVAGLFGDDDLATLEALASQAAVALDNALLFSATDQELTRRVEELRELRRIDRKLNEQLNLDEVLAVTIQSACQLAEADGGHIALLDGESPVPMASVHYPTPDEPHTLQLTKSFPFLLEVMRSVKSRSHETDVNALLGVPLLHNDRLIGVMVLTRASTQPFSENARDLVERVADRASVTIENARLYAAVQAADRAKSEFVGIVAHDLKNPMTSIQGYADLVMMMGDTLDERQKSFLVRIGDTVKRMEMLVSDLADISRIEGGQFYMDESAVSVEKIVEAIRDQTMPQIQSRQHHYVEDVAPDLPEMKTDYYRLLQVLVNLVSNAYKYTPEGGTITLSVQREGNRVGFAVSDTGIGLSEEGKRMLGTKFWRSDDNYTRSQPGTGLGFAITASIVEQMGSKIKIDSEIGKGSRFSFSIATL